MLEFKQTIEEKAYNDMRELVGWRRLDPQQAQTGLDNMYLIVDVMVHPDHQKQGIGRMLLERINGFLGDLASDGRVLMVNLMATPGNEGFYEKFGYVRRPNEEMGSGMVRWINR